MKNKYGHVSDSDEPFKTLIDEKSDTHSSDGTPPPYSDSKNYIDLEMADGSAQNSPGGFDWYIVRFQKVLASILFPISIGYILAYSLILVSYYGFNVSVNATTLWGLFGGFIAAIVLFLIALFVMPKEWFSQAGIVLSNMCVAVIYTALVDVPCFAVYYVAKKTIGFEKMNDHGFYFVCALNVALFVYLTSISYKLRGILDALVPDARQLRIFIADLGNGMGSLANGIGNGIGNGIRNAGNYFRPTDPENEAPQNEEIELQPLAEENAEV